MEVNAIKCPKCEDTIYSRAKYDCRSCSCGKTFIDGGFDYMRVGSKYPTEVESIKINVSATKKELYEDWNLFRDKYGLVKGKKKANKILPEIEVCLEKMDTIEKGASLGRPKKKKCPCSMCKSVGKGVQDIKEGKLIPAETVFKEWEKKHPILTKFKRIWWWLRYGIRNKIENIPLRIRTFIQRGKRGWANSDSWSFDWYLAKVISEGVGNLIKYGNHEVHDSKAFKQIKKTFETAKKISEGDLIYIPSKDFKWKDYKKYQRICAEMKKDFDSKNRVMTKRESLKYREQRIGYNQACNAFDNYFLYLLSKIPSDKEINESPHPNYARAYYQGQFDILMNLKRKDLIEEEENNETS